MFRAVLNLCPKFFSTQRRVDPIRTIMVDVPPPREDGDFSSVLDRNTDRNTTTVTTTHGVAHVISGVANRF